MKAHELRATYRYLHKDQQNWVAKSEVYARIANDAQNGFIKAFGQVILFYLVGNSLRVEDKIALRILEFEVSVSATYFFCTASLTLFAFSLALNHLSTAFSLRISLAGKIRLPGFSTNAWEFLHNRSEYSLGLPTFSNLFLSEKLPTSSLLSQLFTIAILVFVFLICGIGYRMGAEQLDLLMNVELSIFERTASFLGFFFVFASALNTLLFHMPMPMKKEKDSIRWLYLYYLPPHPKDEEKFERWSSIEEDK